MLIGWHVSQSHDCVSWRTCASTSTDFIIYRVARCNTYEPNVPGTVQFVHHIFALGSQRTKKAFRNWLRYLRVYLKVSLVAMNACPPLSVPVSHGPVSPTPPQPSRSWPSQPFRSRPPQRGVYFHAAWAAYFNSECLVGFFLCRARGVPQQVRCAPVSLCWFCSIVSPICFMLFIQAFMLRKLMKRCSAAMKIKVYFHSWCKREVVAIWIRWFLCLTW